MSAIVPLLFLGILFGGTIGGVVLFVNARAKARRAMLQGPWTTLAQQFGGRLAGETVLVTRDGYQLTLDMRLVSAMQAMGSPYYSDGGTFTEARLQFDPRTDLRITASPRPARMSPSELARLIADSPLVRLPPDARIVFTERDARVVFDGAVGDLNAIGTAFAGLDALAGTIQKHGPVPVP